VTIDEDDDIPGAIETPCLDESRQKQLEAGRRL
jgi:hypothetical protein